MNERVGVGWGRVSVTGKNIYDTLVPQREKLRRMAFRQIDNMYVYKISE